MTNALRSLMFGAVDYAGTFPPASLSFGQAAENYRLYRGDSEKWMLGRFVCPAARLAERDLVEAFRHDADARMSVIVPRADNVETFGTVVDEVLARIGKSPVAAAVDTLEFRWPAELPTFAGRAVLRKLVRVAAERILAAKLGRLTMYFEPNRSSESSESSRSESVLESVAALADYNRKYEDLGIPAGFKFRTGGGSSREFPSRAEVAAVICACRDHKVFWKGTAGLHHPLRQFDSAVRFWAHGFLNVLIAAALADAHGFDVAKTHLVLSVGDIQHFPFTTDTIGWRTYSVDAERISIARRRGLRSFGSCSFDEPVRELRALGLS
jgi:hypothetical protein